MYLLSGTCQRALDVEEEVVSHSPPFSLLLIPMTSLIHRTATTSRETAELLWIHFRGAVEFWLLFS